jgi:hypothetical protein
MIKVTIPAGQVPLGAKVSEEGGIATGILTDLNRPGKGLVIAYRDCLDTVSRDTKIEWHAEKKELLEWLSGPETEAAREAASQEGAL